MSWEYFLTRFRAKLAPMIEVQLLASEFKDLCQSTETMAEITAMFWERDLYVL